MSIEATSMNLILKVWRQKNPAQLGRSRATSKEESRHVFLEMLDVVNEA